MKNYLEEHHRFFASLGVLITGLVGLIYLVVVPEVPPGAHWLQELILTYGHSLCWFLLSGASSFWLINRTNKWSKSLSYAALVVYVIFIGTLLITNFM